MLLFAALIAGSFSIGHLAAPHLAPAALNAIRLIFSTAIMGIIVITVVRPVPAAPGSLWRFAIMGGLMATYFVLMFVALEISTPISTGAVFTLMPLMSTGFGWLFLRQTTNKLVLSMLLVGATGALWMIFRGDIDALLRMDVGLGESIFFVGCAAHAAYAPLVRKFRRDEPVLQFAFYTIAATMIWVLIVALPDLIATDWLALPMIVWLAIAYLAIFTTSGTFFLLQFASVRLPASKILSYGYLTPAVVILIEGVIGHGWVSPSIFAGAAVTAFALLVMALAPDS